MKKLALGRVVSTGVVAVVCALVAWGGSGAVASGSPSTDTMYGFESINAWGVTASSGGAVSKSLDSTNRVEGASALKLSYNFASSGNDWGLIEKDVSADTHLLSSIDSFSFWVYNPTSQTDLRIWLKLAEADGSEYESNDWWLSGNQYQMNYTGWRKITIPFASMTLASYSSDPDSGLQVASIKYARIGLDDVPDTTIMSGYVSVDELRFNVAHTSLAYSFDSKADFATATSGVGSSFSLSTDPANHMEGTAGLQLDYSFSSSGSDWGYIEKDVSADLSGASSSTVDRLSLWVYSPAAQSSLRIWIKLAEADGSEYESNGWWLSANQYQLNYGGWRRIVVPFSGMSLASYSSDPDSGLQVASIKYLRIGLDDVPDTANISGYVTLDDFIFDAPDSSHSVGGWSDNSSSGNIAYDGKYEATFTSTWTFSNPYDPDVVEANAYITAPDGNTITIPAFWYQGYTRALVSNTEQLTSSGAAAWKLRYAPRQLGSYSYYIEVWDKASNTFTRYPSGSSTKSFTAVSSANKGFLKVSPSDNAYLEKDDGSFYLGLGHNLVGWEWPGTDIHTDNQKGTYDYDSWLSSMYTNTANLTQFDFAEGDQLEWTYNASELPFSASWNGVTQYNQQTAWKMDYRFDKAEQLGIFYRVGLWHWEDFDGESSTTFPDWGWNRNPYNSARGGPAANVPEFFTQRKSISLQEKTLRYILARYGYSKNVLAWELWNELNLADFSPSSYGAMEPALIDWHSEIARYIKVNDPNKHLETTSFSDSNIGTASGSYWSLPEMDITTFHRYTYYNQDYAEGYKRFDTEELMDDLVNVRRASVAKPVVAGEFALSPGGDIQHDHDPAGLAFHNQLWSSVMAKSLGTAMSWSWGSYIDAYNLYYHYAPLGTFLAGADLRGYTQFKNFDIANSGVLSYTLDSTSGWSTTTSASATLSISPNSSTVITGSSGSLKLDYSLSSSGSDWGYIKRDIVADVASHTMTNIDKISFWVYNPTAQANGRVWLKLVESDGSEYESNGWWLSANQYQLNWTGWRRIDIPLSQMTLASYSSDPDTGLQLTSLKYLEIGVDDVPDSATLSGSLYVDSIVLADAIRYSGLKGSQAAYVWVQDRFHTYSDQDAFATPWSVRGQSFNITGLTNGTYRLTFYDTYSGSVLATTSATTASGTLTIVIPSFSNDVPDVAVKATKNP